MDFNLNEEQKMFKDSAETFLEKEWTFELLREIIQKEQGYSVNHWEKIADLGWMGMIIDEKYGGLGCTFMDLCPIIEEIGRALFPSPLFSSAIMGASVLLEGASEEIKEKLLPSIASGDVITTLAVGESGRDWSKDEIKTTAKKSGDGYVLNGVKMFVPFAHVSDYIICCAKDESGDTALFLVDAKATGVECVPIPTFSIDKYNEVVFDGVMVAERDVIGEIGGGWDLIEKVMPKLVASKCIEIIGGLEKVLDITVQYVKEREQFGVPIGSFQVIQHYLASIAIDVQASKFIAYQAMSKVSANLPCKKEVSIAKAWCGEAYSRAVAIALQSHGAMGFTEEYDLHFYCKQAKSLQLMYGGGTYHRSIVAQEEGY